ncbi:unnamed protein product [Boreogadus saida]
MTLVSAVDRLWGPGEGLDPYSLAQDPRGYRTFGRRARWFPLREVFSLRSEARRQSPAQWRPKRQIWTEVFVTGSLFSGAGQRDSHVPRARQ